jgi:hypothetical protein
MHEKPDVLGIRLTGSSVILNYNEEQNLTRLREDKLSYISGYADILFSLNK